MICQQLPAAVIGIQWCFYDGINAWALNQLQGY
jgi:hypothetical protein